jgi:hypothetical protein
MPGRAVPQRRADGIEICEQVAALLLDDPRLTGSELQLQLGCRRADVLRCARLVRRLAGFPKRGPGRPRESFPSAQERSIRELPTADPFESQRISM